jgi:iron(III) transport system substrate-binding protein
MHPFRTGLIVNVVLALVLTACTGGSPGGPGASQSVQGSANAEWQAILDKGKSEGTLLVYAQWFTGTEATSIAEEFKRVSGIPVDFITGNGAQLVQRYLTEVKGGAPSADVIEGSPQFLTDLRRDGGFVPLKGKPLPVLSEPVDVWRTPPTFMGDSIDVVVSRPTKADGHVTINTNLLKPPDYPTSYHDLAVNPKYKGKIAFNDPKTTGNVAAHFVKQGYISKTLVLEDVWALYTRQEAMLFGRPGDQEAAVARGEATIAIGSGSDRLGSIAEAGAPIKILAFADTPIVGFPQMIGVLKTAQRPNAGMVFLDWMNSREGQDYIKKLKGSDDGPRRDVPSYVPDLLKGEVVGGGKFGPIVVASPAQTVLGAELNNGDIFQKLTDGIPLAEFESKVNAAIKDWEGRQNGQLGGEITIPQ